MALIFISISASVGLTSWPGQFLYSFAVNPSPKAFINAFGGYAFLITVIFWGSMPSIFAQRVIMLTWPISTYFLWKTLHNDIDIGWFSDAEFGVVTFLAVSMATPSLIYLLWRVFNNKINSASLIESNLRWLLLLMVVFALVPKSALDLTVSLHPYTYDIYALKFDASAGLNIIPIINHLVETIPGLRELLWLAYGTTPLAFLALCLKQLKEQENYLPNALLLWVVITLCAIISYHFFPITGPKYIFGPSEYISKLREPNLLLLELTTGVGPNPRNGMPSMHFGWMFTATVIWLQSKTTFFSKIVMIAMTLCVSLATLYLGEHYVIDLIVAVPFSLAAVALTTTGVAFSTSERWRTVALGFGCWLIWVLLLRNQITFFIDYPWTCWLLIAGTLLIVVMQTSAMSRFDVLTTDLIEPHHTLTKQPQVFESPSLTQRMGLMFFASGAAALIYQVLFAKELALVFGSTATATFTVLATFLGGMAIGSLLGGVLAARVTRPIAAYAMVELAIAGFCVLTPTLFAALQGAYVFLAADVPPASPTLVMLRVALGASVLLVPTVLMGITLPLLAQALNPSGHHLGGSVAWLYACNTAGAALGAILTSYLVIPLVGAHSTTLIAAMMNLLVALGALELAKRSAVMLELPTGVTAFGNHEINQSTQLGGRWVLAGAWLALGVGGVLSLGLEVVYVHLLSIVAGNSVYAFGLMLATFLVGLALGGEAGRRLLACAKADRAAWLALSQLGLAAAVALGAWGWDMIPAYFASFAGYPLVTSFQSREAVRAIVCALVMIPPTVCIGLSYTLAMDLATTATRRRGITMLGWSAAINTFGNIVGVLLFGFVLLPWLGGLITAKIIAVSAMCIAAVVATSIASSQTQRWVGMSAVVVALLVWLSPTRLDYEMLSSGANVYFAPQNWGKVIDHAESIDGGLTTVTRSGDGEQKITTLLTNGKFQGNDASKGEVQAQIGFAALPLLHQDHRDNALVIGYGTGATSRVFHDAGFGHIDIAELSRDVVTLSDTYFPDINRRVSGLPGVQTHITDGRNFLLLTRRNYDVISIEITSIWFAGAASLYNREFYQLARSKLRHDGVLQQWVQLHHMAPTDLLTIIGTLRSEFTYVSLYVVGGQGILIATNDAAKNKPSSHTITALDTLVRLQPVRELAGRTFANIADDLLLTPAQVDVFLNRVGIDQSLWISTDNNLRLEYSRPKANASPPDRSFQINMKLLTSITDTPELIGSKLK
ncbi:MAG: fused MFS/spermidine synthase [Rhodoferax sp.]|nr:fused MFS/spermidine synthase [Rhodoferax sp.]